VSSSREEGAALDHFSESARGVHAQQFNEPMALRSLSSFYDGMAPLS
jgi:hypothetical protein